jgi:hypothetical protein
MPGEEKAQPQQSGHMVLKQQLCIPWLEHKFPGEEITWQAFWDELVVLLRCELHACLNAWLRANLASSARWESYI